MGRKSRVLLVDDQPEVLNMLSLFFERAGFEVETAVDGQTALQKVTENRPDIMVLDMMMPGMNGIDVCRQLRSQPQTAQLPILMLSAKGEVADRVQGLEAGADDYIVKPVARRELLARANALLHRARYGQSPAAQVLAFVGAKGGVGVTTVALNMAAALATQGKTVNLIELQAHPGTMVHHLNLASAQNLGDLLAVAAAGLDWRDVNRQVVQHTTGLQLLTAPQDTVDHQLTPQHALAVINALMLRANFLLLDISIMAGEAVQRALEQANQIILITEPEIVSVKAARVKLNILRAWGLYERTRVAILSRTPSTTNMQPIEVETELGLEHGRILGIIPPAPEAFQQASQMGVPVIIGKPHILSARALWELTNSLLERGQGS